MANRIGRLGSRRRGAYMAMAGAMAAMLIGSAGARADTTDQLLDQLKAKGILTKAEYAKLKERHAAEVASRAPAAHAAPGAPAGRYVTALDKGIGVHIPGQAIVTKDQGVVTVGDIDIKISGDLIFFGAEQFKTGVSGTAGILGGGVYGGLAGGSTVNNANAIRSGLLPSDLVVSIATNQLGFDIGFTLGLYTGGNNVFVGGNVLNANGPGTATGLGTSGVDLRQVFGTIGTPQWGTIKVGRDLGLFAGDAILNDFTLLGVGTPAGTAQPGNTSLGRIGLGYIYADWIPQITYTTPDFYGFTATAGLFSPYNEFPSTGLTPFSGTPGFAPGVPAGGGLFLTSGQMTAHDQPQFQGRLKYIGKFAPDVKLTAWVDGITQLQRVEAGDAIALAITPGTAARASGVDGGARLDWGGFSAVGYGYWGNGLGTTALFFSGISPNGETRKSWGWYAEAEYTLWDRFTLGGSYGASFLEANAFDFTQAYVPFLVRENASAIGFARYKLTDWVSFQAEFINSISRNQSGGGFRTNAFVAGTTFFF